jgi:hypothetical protein
MVTLGPAELRTGLDFRLEPAPAGTITAKIVGTADGPVEHATAILLPSAETARVVETARYIARTDSTGVLQFWFVPRGQYVLEVRANVNEAGRIPLWASVPVSVADTPTIDLVVPLNPGMTVGGEIRYASSHVESAVRGLRGVQASLSPGPALVAAGANSVRTPIDPDGRFKFDDLPPGGYSLRMEGLPYGWLVSSAVLEGRDLLDTGLRVQPGKNLEGLVVTLTDQMPEVNGVLRDRSDRPVTSGWVILFSSDKADWTGSGRRMQGVRPGTAGEFVFRNVPPGSYLVAAAEAEPGEWLDPAFLETLVPRAVRTTVRAGEQTPGIILRK